MIFCPYHGLDDPTGRTEFFAVDSEGNLVPSNRLPSPKYSVEQQNNTIVLTINDYSPTEDLYHTFVCNTMNQAGQDSQSITLQGKNVLRKLLESCHEKAMYTYTYAQYLNPQSFDSPKLSA